MRAWKSGNEVLLQHLHFRWRLLSDRIASGSGFIAFVLIPTRGYIGTGYVSTIIYYLLTLTLLA